MLSWILLLVGGLFEVGFVTFMKLSNGFKILKYTLLSALSVAISLYLLALALVELPVGVGYAVWAGVGAVGSVFVGIVFFNESKSLRKMFFVLLIIAGIVGLNLATG